MPLSPDTAKAGIDRAVKAYRQTDNFHQLLVSLQTIAEVTDPDTLATAVEPYRSMPEIAGPVYERIVNQRPDDARSLVILANAYWLTGRGPDVVEELAARAIASDPDNRGAWHLWALTEPNVRARVSRWKQVAERFPDDDLAYVNFADNAASLASIEHDEQALADAISAYESLLARGPSEQQGETLRRALDTLRGWRL
jgi:tetratricopeptide (TPR) repeat protein